MTEDIYFSIGLIIGILYVVFVIINFTVEITDLPIFGNYWNNVQYGEDFEIMAIPLSILIGMLIMIIYPIFLIMALAYFLGLFIRKIKNKKNEKRINITKVRTTHT